MDASVKQIYSKSRHEVGYIVAGQDGSRGYIFGVCRLLGARNYQLFSVFPLLEDEFLGQRSDVVVAANCSLFLFTIVLLEQTIA